MSSSIEEEFNPPEWASREEVIKAARHYINYWKIEARQRNAQWLEAIKPRPPAWQPIDTAPKDGEKWMLGYYTTEHGESLVDVICRWSDGTFTDSCDNEVHPTHWMPLPTPPAYEARS